MVKMKFGNFYLSFICIGIFLEVVKCLMEFNGVFVWGGIDVVWIVILLVYIILLIVWYVMSLILILVRLFVMLGVKNVLCLNGCKVLKGILFVLSI